MQWVVEPTALDWTHDRLDDFFAGRVGSLVPRGFEAYARVLPPVGDGEQLHRWSDVAAWSGVPLEPSSSFADIATRSGPDGPERWPGGVHQGTPEPDVARALAEVLGAGAADQPCWFAVWEGYGWVWGGILHMSTDPAEHGARPESDELAVPADVRDGPRASRPYRSYVLYTGAVEEALAIADSTGRWTYDDTPDLWWPADRSWFVGADTDLTCVYLGTSRATADRLLADTRLEVQLVDRDDRLT